MNFDGVYIKSNVWYQPGYALWCREWNNNMKHGCDVMGIGRLRLDKYRRLLQACTQVSRI